MNKTIPGAALAALLAATVPADAGDFSFGSGLKQLEQAPVQASVLAPELRYGAGLKEMVPAPIPVPGAMPVPEGFTYYLRADFGWAFASDASFSETGAEYGVTPLVYSGLATRSTSTGDVFTGTVGAGMYLTPRFRGDLTLDFRSEQDVDAVATYVDAPVIAGVVTDTLKVARVVGLVNVYWDLLPRGLFTPYIGAGIGLVYNDISRTHLTTEDVGGGPVTVKTGANASTNVGLAAALMAGASISFSHQWALDLSYRALYLDGGSITTTLTNTPTPSRATLSDMWEHQVRVGIRLNIW